MPDQAEQVCYDQMLISVGTQLSTGRTLPVARLGAAVNDAIGMFATGICRHALKRPPWAQSYRAGFGRGWPKNEPASREGSGVLVNE
jgi:hypothetical protein